MCVCDDCLAVTFNKDPEAAFQCQFAHVPIHPPSHPSIYSPTNLFFHPPTNPSIYPSIHPSIHSFVHPLIRSFKCQLYVRHCSRLRVINNTDNKAQTPKALSHQHVRSTVDVDCKQIRDNRTSGAQGDHESKVDEGVERDGGRWGGEHSYGDI